MNNLFRKLSAIRKKLALWGLKGALDYFLRQGKEKKEREFYYDNARRHPYQKPEKGITVVGQLTSRGSFAKALRDFTLALKEAGIPFQTLDTGDKKAAPSEMEGILTPSEAFAVRRFSHSVEMISSRIPNGIVDHRARLVFWEFNEGVVGGYPCLLECDDPIIAMSDFNFEYFKREFGTSRKVVRIPYPLRLDMSDVPGKSLCREKFGLGRDDFIVFFNFGFSAGWHRKNPIGAVRAFAKAFRDVPDARFVLKTFDKDRYPEREAELLRVAEAEGVRDRIVQFDTWMSEREIFELTNACDVYLSLHRAEGFGLGIAEAMCLSKAVVATDYSAPTEFCRPGHSMPIPFHKVDVPRDEKESDVLAVIREVRSWAEPDINMAAKALRRLHDDPAFRERLGVAARHFVEDAYSINRFRAAVLDFLKAE